MRTFSARVGFAVMLIGFGAAIGMFWMADCCVDGSRRTD